MLNVVVCSQRTCEQKETAVLESQRATAMSKLALKALQDDLAVRVHLYWPRVRSSYVCHFWNCRIGCCSVVS